MEEGAIAAGVVSAAALVVSLLFLARQTRASAEQNRLANQIASSEVKADIFQSVDRILYRLLDFPSLRPFFYDDAPLPGVDDVELRALVLTTAELFANVIERGLDSYLNVDPASDFPNPMDAYARDVLAASPALRGLVASTPQWWPHLAEWVSGAGVAPQPHEEIGPL